MVLHLDNQDGAYSGRDTPTYVSYSDDGKSLVSRAMTPETRAWSTAPVRITPDLTMTGEHRGSWKMNQTFNRPLDRERATQTGSSTVT